MSLLRTLLLGSLPILPTTAQSITATNLGGGCGATQGYPTLGAGDRLLFYLQRPMCPTNGWAWPTGVILDLAPPRFPLPFALGTAPGCVIIAPSSYLPSGPVGGSGTNVFVADLPRVPLPLTVYVQGVAICSVGGNVPMEIAFSDAWRLAIR